VARRAHPAREGVEHLRRVDPILCGLIDRVGRFGMAKKRHKDHFGSLSRAIVYQQLSGKAAGTIHGRYLALFPEAPHPKVVLDADPAALRGAGLSAAKVAALRDLSAAALDGRLPLPATSASAMPPSASTGSAATPRPPASPASPSPGAPGAPSPPGTSGARSTYRARAIRNNRVNILSLTNRRGRAARTEPEQSLSLAVAPPGQVGGIALAP
jgi:hypothetical protein